MQEVRAPQNEIDPIFDEFGFEYATAGRVDDQSELNRMNEICRIKGRAGVGLLSTLPVVEKRYGLPGLEEDVDSGRWIEADVQTPQGYVITVTCVYVHAGNTDDPEKMKQKYRFLDTMLARMEQLRDEAAHGGKHAARHQKRQSQRNACRISPQRARICRQMAGRTGVCGCDA